MFQSTVAPSADWASAVATKEATDEDSNALRGRTASEVAVAIRKPAGAGNGYRVLDEGLQKRESPVPPLCGDTGLQKRSKVFSG